MRPAAAPREGEDHRVGLSFLATLAFVGGFFGSRIFHTAFPSLMIFVGGIHFHHFWYGLAMILVSGWLGIVYNDERLNRVYAVVFGLGAGFMGDEVGLLLTFGDYTSELTSDFFVGAICFILLMTLILKYRQELLKDVLGVGTRERTSHLGIFLLGFSALFFAFGLWYVGLPLAILGSALFVWGFERRREDARAAG